MKIYEIALMIVRASAAIEFVHAGVEFAYTVVRFVFMMLGGAFSSHWLTWVEISTFLSPIETLIAGVVILSLAKPIAKFAAKYAVLEHFE